MAQLSEFCLDANPKNVYILKIQLELSYGGRPWPEPVRTLVQQFQLRNLYAQIVAVKF